MPIDFHYQSISGHYRITSEFIQFLSMIISMMNPNPNELIPQENPDKVPEINQDTSPSSPNSAARLGTILSGVASTAIMLIVRQFM